MAHEVKLELYVYRIKDLKNRQYIALDDFFKKNDFFTFFQNYVKAFDNQILVNDNLKKSLQFQSKSNSLNTDKRLISGIIESGDYGVEGNIFNIPSGKHKYTKTIDDTESKPFYFLLSAPKKQDKGLLVLQRLGVFGINNIFCSHLSEYFKNSYPDYKIEFAPFVSKALAKSIIERGHIKEITLRRYDLPTDIIDKLGLTGHKEEILSIEFRIRAKRKKNIQINDKVKKFINSPNAKLFDMPELDKLGFNGEHSSKMKVTHGKNIRTIDLTESGQLRPYYDIDDEVEKHANGHPLFSSIDEIAKEHLEDLYNEIFG